MVDKQQWLVNNNGWLLVLSIYCKNVLRIKVAWLVAFVAACRLRPRYSTAAVTTAAVTAAVLRLLVSEAGLRARY